MDEINEGWENLQTGNGYNEETEHTVSRITRKLVIVSSYHWFKKEAHFHGYTVVRFLTDQFCEWRFDHFLTNLNVVFFNLHKNYEW